MVRSDQTRRTPANFVTNAQTCKVLARVFAQISGMYDANWDLRAVAAIVTTSVPLIVFLVFQRQFASGALVSTGSKE